MKKIIISFLAAIALISTANSAFAQDKTLAISAGSGFQYFLAEEIEYGIPIVFSFQFALFESFSLEVDGYYTFFTETGDEMANFSYEWTIFQIGAIARFWFDEAFNGFYLGGGLAYSYISVEAEFGPYKLESSETYATMVFKLGYVISFTDSIGLDLGLRYDALNFNFAEAPIGLTAAFVFKI